MYHYTDCGLPNVFLRSGFIVREIDGEEAVAIHNLDGLHKVIGLDILHKAPILTGDEIRFLRKEMDLTQNSLGKIIGVSEDTVRGWETGRHAIPSPADKLLRGLYSEQINGDGSLRELLKGIGRLDRKIAEDERQMNFEENEGDWQLAA